jgi:hypothetical protein
MIKVEWDIEEVVALVDLCFRRENNEISNEELDIELHELSEVLNKRADILNIIHDEKFRNYAGIRKQYYFRVLKTVSNGEKGSPSGVPRKIDYEVVNLYKTNRFIFNRILEEFNRKYR